jgi:serine/threonine protein kinase
MLLTLDQNIDHYRIDALLGEGGMGAVYQAYDLNLARKVALKVIHSQLAKEPYIQDRFLKEAQAAARLEHPSVVRIYSFESRADFLYLVMEYVPGPSLSVYLRLKQDQNEPVGLDELLRLLAQVADVLDYSHGQGIVHRDIKPDNLLLKTLTEPDRKEDPLLQVMVTDFGLIKLLDGGQHTQTEAFMGNLAYMSPEQCLGQTLDGRSDIYSLGILTYQMVTGMLPFNVQSPTEAVHSQVYETPVNPGQINPGIPDSVDRIIMRSLVKDPAGRFQTGKQLATALGKASESMSTTDLTRWELSGVAAIAATQLLAEEPAGNLLSEIDGSAIKNELEHDRLRLMRKGETPITIDNPYLIADPDHIELEAGAAGYIQLSIRNNGTLVDHFRIRVNNLPSEWVQLSEEQVGLIPGARTFIRVTIQPPHDSSALAGEYLFQIVAMPVSEPLNASRIEGKLKLKSFEAFSVNMQPQQIQHDGLTRVLVKNVGNAEGVFAISIQDLAGVVRLKDSDLPLTVPPGGQATRDIRLSSRKRPIAGRVTSRLFTLQVRSKSGQLQSIRGRLDVPPNLSTWLFFILCLLILLLCVTGATLTYWLATNNLR